MLWTLIALRRRTLGSLRGLAAGAALGLFGYSVQAGLYFGALQRIDAGVASLLLYAYPAFVTVAAIALRRESPSRRKLGALALASGGVALVLLGGGPGGDRPRGRRDGDRLRALLHGLHPRVRLPWPATTSPPVPFAASVATGSALTFGIAALLERRHRRVRARA